MRFKGGLNQQMVTIRPLNDRSDDADAFGDAPIIASKNRTKEFRCAVHVEWTRAELRTITTPGVVENLSVIATLWKRDLPVGFDDYVPQSNDIWELAGGKKLFVVEAPPEGSLPRRIGRPSGGFAGWRVVLSDQNPVQRAAESYE